MKVHGQNWASILKMNDDLRDVMYADIAKRACNIFGLPSKKNGMKKSYSLGTLMRNGWGNFIMLFQFTNRFRV